MRQRIHPLRSRRVRYRRTRRSGCVTAVPGRQRHGVRTLLRSDLVRTDGCNATSPEIRARSFAHSRGAGQVVIRYRASWIRSAGFSRPIARIGARHSYRPPRREATRSRHVTSRPAGAQRGRQAARSADEPIPRRRSRRPCPAAVSHEDSPASRTEARRCRPEACGPRCTTFPDDVDAGRSPALRVAPHSRMTSMQAKRPALRAALHSRIDVDAGQPALHVTTSR